MFWCLLFLGANAQSDTTQVDGHIDSPNHKFAKRQTKHLNRIENDSLTTSIKVDTALVTIPSLTDTGLNRFDTSAKKGTDTVSKVAKEAVSKPIDSIYIKLFDNPFFRTTAKPEYLLISEKVHNNKDELFYILLALMFFLGLVKLLFSRYFSNLFRQFIQPSFRQKQTREQLSQNNFPSLLLNLFFIFSGGVFIALLMNYYELSKESFGTNFIYSTVALLTLYAAKYVLLSFAGWVFNVKEATETYIFIVFLINKIMGIVLMPFSFIIAFSHSGIITVSVTYSLLIIFILFLYRYIAAISPVRREIKINILHFVLYILAFEITPLLLIYKTLGIYLAKSA